MSYKRQNNEIGFKIRNTDLQILTNNDEVCIPSLSSILLAVIISDIFQVLKSCDISF